MVKTVKIVCSFLTKGESVKNDVIQWEVGRKLMRHFNRSDVRLVLNDSIINALATIFPQSSALN